MYRNVNCIMGSLCCCFPVPEVEENVESNPSNHGNCSCLNCSVHNLKTKYGAFFGRGEMHAGPSHGQVTTASSSSAVAPNNPEMDTRSLLPNNPNISTKISSGVNMQLGSNSRATSKECHVESKKLPGKVLMASRECVDSILEEEDVCPTCLEEFTPDNPKITTHCRHDYHLSCIYEWQQRSEKCPVCAKVMVFEEMT